MCLTIPKKVLEIRGNVVVVEDHNGARQELKTLIDLSIGDFVMSQQNVVIEKMEKQEAEEIFNIIKGGQL
ncbi:MAG: HypC/HybG/HupF family hydrogenase formation chaperone [Candidatus Moranbacteria bacterium]|nr:HypC/HybG/HupF family hydrogenase formation chaperone [Candidatus Moranbacteria bacterium]